MAKQDRRPGEFVETPIRVPLKVPRASPPIKVSKRHRRHHRRRCRIPGGNRRRHHHGCPLAFGGMATSPNAPPMPRPRCLERPLPPKPFEAAARRGRDFQPLSDWRASAEYRQQLAPIFAASGWNNPAPNTACGGQMKQDVTQRAQPIARSSTIPRKSMSPGAPDYTDDLNEPTGTLYACLGLSAVAHGRSLAMIWIAVRKAPGVHLGPDGWISRAKTTSAPTACMTSRSCLPLVQFHGQPIFSPSSPKPAICPPRLSAGPIDLTNRRTLRWTPIPPRDAAWAM